MSVTSLLNKGFTNFVADNIGMPEIEIKSDTFIPPLTKNYSLVGTAFDYLLRCELIRRYPKAREDSNIASIVRDLLIQAQQKSAFCTLRSGKDMIKVSISELLTLVNDIYGKFQLSKKAFIETGLLSNEFLKDIIKLAQLDPIYRAGYLDPNLTKVDVNDIKNLKELYNIVPNDFLGLGKSWLLDTTFPGASELVNGADVDLIADHIMIDIKTIKDLHLDKKIWAQIVAYSILADISSSSSTFPKLEEVGIYFSRHATLWKTDVNIIYKNRNYKKVKEKLIEMGEEERVDIQE